MEGAEAMSSRAAKKRAASASAKCPGCSGVVAVTRLEAHARKCQPLRALAQKYINAFATDAIEAVEESRAAAHGFNERIRSLPESAETFEAELTSNGPTFSAKVSLK